LLLREKTSLMVPAMTDTGVVRDRLRLFSAP
jgi:hypothetical protein